MRDPLGDAARGRLTDAAEAFLHDCEFSIERPETRAEPPAIATRGDHHFGIEPLTADDATPTTVVSRIGHALERDRRALFVVGDDSTEAALRELLAEPALLVADADGRRTFHAGPDRIPLESGGYACLHYDGPDEPDIVWRETDTPLGPVPSVADVDPTALTDEGTPAIPRLVCELDGRVVAVFGGVESLRTPPETAVPYRYRRDPHDKQFRVFRTDDDVVVETCSGISALKRAGYHPLPMPLVPEHVLGSGARIGDAWALLRVDDDPHLVRK